MLGKKVGILTFHRAENFGAVMQALALLEYLKSLGYDVEIIDYRCKDIERQYDLYDWKNILTRRKNILASIWDYLTTYSKKRVRKNSYIKMRSQYYRLSPVVKNVDDINNLNFDVIIIGSDQVWNQRITKGFDEVYWGHFNNNTRVVSYAASSESKSVSEYHKSKDIICNSLSCFYSISCREHSMSEALSTLTGLSIETVLDPTFLQDENFYRLLSERPQISDYILVYHLTESEMASSIAKKLSEDMKLPIVEIHVEKNRYSSHHLHVVSPGPAQVLGYIANASYILTTSFHGTAFSLIFRKQFFVIESGNNQRMKDLLELLNLRDRLVDDYHRGTTTPIDYEEVWEILHSEIKKSKNYLKNCLC